ncbi:MAG: UDP-N-acetylmuramoyl-tripeptide--D-alanyl-D-alanine ligase [Saprospiraceae bacterium]
MSAFFIGVLLIMNVSLDVIYDLFVRSENVVIDSRAVSHGSLFFALKGENVDGNQFALLAIKNGAIGAIVDDFTLEGQSGCFVVEDSLKTLQDLAKLHRSKFQFPVIGLTGSNGKTTTKELVHSVLKRKFNVVGTKGNLNNHIGVPLTILNVKNNLDFLIVEMGANHQGEIEALCQISNPNYGFITNIGKAHLEGFGCIDGVKKGKSELYRFIEKNKGELFVNGEDPILCSLLPQIPKNKVHYYYPSAYQVSNIQDDFLHFTMDDQVYTTHLVGEYNLSNAVCAICIAKFFGVESNEIASAIEQYMPNNNRSQMIKHKDLTIIMDAYNANPSSMKVSIENFAKENPNQKVLVLGDMFELGDFAEQEHRGLIHLVQGYPWAMVIFIGQQFWKHRKTGSNHLFFNTLEDARHAFKSLENRPLQVLLKGSRGIALEKLLLP